MNLQQVTEELLKTSTTVQSIAAKLVKLEWEYQKRYNQLLLESQRSDQARREAEATEIMREEGSLEKYYETKLDFKNAVIYKEVLIEVSRNLRVMEISKSDYKTVTE